VLAGALFLRTFRSLTSTSTGMDPAAVAVATVNANRLAPAADGVRTRFTDLLEAVRATPGVAAAGYSNISPMSGGGWNTVIGGAEGAPLVPDRQHLSWVNTISPDWFKTFGIRVLAGRDFDAHDVEGAAAVAIVNEAFARKFLANATVVGARITAAPASPTTRTFTVVGLVNDAIYRSVRAGFEPTVYFPVAQFPDTKVLTLGVRASGESVATVATALGRTITRAMPDAGFTVRLLSQQIGANFGQERLLAMLAGFFGGLALFLAAIGLYGVTSYTVSRRRAEIGIRMALGADRVGVVRMVVSRVIVLVAIGVALGAGLSFWASTFVTKLLFHVTPHDPATFVGAALVLALAAILAGWLPARRAASIDPARVLRDS
jgi:predicted permease